MAGEDQLALGGKTHGHLVIAHGQPQGNIAQQMQLLGGLLLVQDEDRAVGQGAETRRDERAIHLLAQDADLDAAMVFGQEHAAAHSRGHHNGGIRPQAVRLGERAFYHRAQVLAAIAALLLGAALDAHQRLGGHLRDFLGGQEHGDRVILAGGRVVHGASDCAFKLRPLLPLAASRRDLLLQVGQRFHRHRLDRHWGDRWARLACGSGWPIPAHVAP